MTSCEFFSVTHKFFRIVTKFWIRTERTDRSHGHPADTKYPQLPVRSQIAQFVQGHEDYSLIYNIFQKSQQIFIIIITCEVTLQPFCQSVKN